MRAGSNLGETMEGAGHEGGFWRGTRMKLPANLRESRAYGVKRAALNDTSGQGLRAIGGSGKGRGTS